MLDQWQTISCLFINVGSMILGAVAAIGQTNIKRLMAYSSIGHIGYALAGIATGSSSRYSKYNYLFNYLFDYEYWCIRFVF